MKKLLVLTDFTDNAFHAETAALQLAGKTGADILLYHTLPYIPLLPSDSGGPYMAETSSVLFEDSKERLIQEADKLREMAVMKRIEVQIEEQNEEGSLGSHIEEITSGDKAELVIMGGRSGGALEHILSGSDTATVIRKSKKPVLVIPSTAAINVPDKVVFASDFGISDIPALRYLDEFTQILGCGLHIVHMLPHGEVKTEISAELAFRKYLDERRFNFDQVFADNVHEGLQKYCSEKKADMLAMTHGQHSFLSRLFGHSETMAAIADNQLAVLVFPPDYK